MSKTYYAEFHFDNLENYPLLNNDKFKEMVKQIYVKGRSKACDVFNEYIGEVNEEWDKLGKPASSGSYVEDINPEYSQFVRDSFKQRFINLNAEIHNEFNCPLEFFLDDVCDIRARLRIFPEVEIWITLREG